MCNTAVVVIKDHDLVGAVLQDAHGTGETEITRYRIISSFNIDSSVFGIYSIQPSGNNTFAFLDHFLKWDIVGFCISMGCGSGSAFDH